MSEFSEFAASLKPHPLNAQILVEIRGDQQTLENALDAIKASGVSPARYEIINQSHANWILIQLSSDDMRNAVLKMSEAGFTKVIGVNPRKGDDLKTTAVEGKT